MRDCPTCHLPYDSAALQCPECEAETERLRSFLQGGVSEASILRLIPDFMRKKQANESKSDVSGGDVSRKRDFVKIILFFQMIFPFAFCPNHVIHFLR